MPRHGRSSILLIAVLMLIASAARAAPLEDLYVAEVLVPDDGKEHLAAGAREGLMQVLVRVSGTTAVRDDPAMRRALANASQYYYQYSYDATDQTLDVDGEPVQARILKVSYEPSAVARLLRSGGFRVWGSNRPTIMLWIAVNDGSGRHLISESDNSELVKSLNRQAKRRGLPLLYPLLDLEDEASLSTAAVWGFFLDKVSDASQRYNPDSILTARVQRLGDGRWSAHWSYQISGKWMNVDNVADDVDDLVQEVVDKIADDLVSRYAIGSGRGFVWMQIEGVDSLEDYASVGSYLEKLLPVVDTQVEEVNGDEVVYRLNTEGKSRQLVDIIELDKKMVLLNPAAVDQGKPLHYRWLD
jgi:hypothetical protein